MSDRVSESWTDGWSIRERIKGLRDRFYLGPRAGGHWWGPLEEAAVYPSEQVAREVDLPEPERVEIISTRLQDGKTVLR